MKLLYSWLNIWRTLGAYTLVNFCRDKSLILEEIDCWSNKNSINFCQCRFLRFTYLIVRYKEYRNLFKYRLNRSGIIIGCLGKIAMIFLPLMDSLKIFADKIGRNFYIEHGVSTIVSAKEIGDNCWVNQQVTIGYSLDNHAPIIKNGVRICAGAKVIGDIIVADNAIIGANSVVIKNVNSNEIVAGVPAKKINNNTEHLLWKQKE